MLNSFLHLSSLIIRLLVVIINSNVTIIFGFVAKKNPDFLKAIGNDSFLLMNKDHWAFSINTTCLETFLTICFTANGDCYTTKSGYNWRVGLSSGMDHERSLKGLGLPLHHGDPTLTLLTGREPRQSHEKVAEGHGHLMGRRDRFSPPSNLSPAFSSLSGDPLKGGPFSTTP